MLTEFSDIAADHIPQKIVALSAESAEWLLKIGAWDQVTGVTAFFQQPENITQKPIVSGFSSASLFSIVAGNPDLVIAFSDVQANLCADLMKAGITVLGTNQRTLQETFDALALIARVAGHDPTKHIADLTHQLAPISQPARRVPRVYFEEWDEPRITAASWIQELIVRAGGEPCFANLAGKGKAKDRVVSDEAVIKAAPDIIIASWCGKPFDRQSLVNRPNWGGLPAVVHGRIYEIAGSDILAPGPGLVRGYQILKRLMASFS